VYGLRVLKSAGPVHLTTIRRTYQGKDYVSHLLRRSYREGDKVKSQTCLLYTSPSPRD